MRHILSATMLVCLMAVVHAAEPEKTENPWKIYKVGDWVSYKNTGAGFEGTTKMTITAKDDKEVTYKIEATFTAAGKKMVAPVQTQKIDLTKPYDAIAARNMKAKGVTIETVGEGKEKLKIGDKEYDTTWKKLKATSKIMDIEMVSEYKMWFCKDVPLGGLVRMDTEVGAITSKLEITGSGSGDKDK
jgi:hypothetical protein